MRWLRFHHRSAAVAARRLGMSLAESRPATAHECFVVTILGGAVASAWFLVFACVRSRRPRMFQGGHDARGVEKKGRSGIWPYLRTSPLRPLWRARVRSPSFKGAG